MLVDKSLRLIATLCDKEVQLELTQRAEQALQQRQQPLCVEMELYFSCLIRKQVRFRESLECEFSVQLNDKLHLGFRPVMTKSCSVLSCGDESPPLSDFPIEKPESYIPRWLKLDYKKGKWTGEFGY